MKYFVTGGTGFLGKNLVRRLADGANNVTVLVRPTSQTQGLDLPGVTLAPGDVTDADSLKRGMAGCDRVFHLAAMVKEWAKDRSVFDRINVDAVDTICQLSVELGVERVVHTSSFMALGQTDGGIVNEESPRDPNHVHNDYERTKLLAEAVVERHVQAGAPVISVYPGVIYGPGEITDGNILVKLILDHLQGRLPGIPGSGERSWSYAYVDDVVEGHLLAMEKGTPGERYILGGAEASVNRFFEILAAITGRPAPKRHLPIGLLKPIAALYEARAVLFGCEPKLTRGALGVYQHDWVYDSSKAEQALGYQSRSLEEGLRATYAWLQEIGRA